MWSSGVVLSFICRCCSLGLNSSVLAEHFELCLELPDVRVLQGVLNSWGLMHFCVCVLNWTHKKLKQTFSSILVQTEPSFPSSLTFCFPAHKNGTQVWVFSGSHFQALGSLAAFDFSVFWDLCFLPLSTDGSPHWNVMLYAGESKKPSI